MLAQSFMTAADLGIEEVERQALIKVLGMLERGELHDAKDADEGENLFCMSMTGAGCGTPACIGGWVAVILDIDQYDYVWSHAGKSLADLYFGYNDGDVYPSVATAAIALRSKLSSGDARWDLALSDQQSRGVADCAGVQS